MKNVLIVFGGRSVEHDISILTALHAYKHTPEGWCVRLVYLTRDNVFVTGRRLADLDFYINGVRGAREVHFSHGAMFRRGKKICDVDAVLNCCHGGVGEGGELAAFFRVHDIPTTGPNMVSAANLMCKTTTRRVLTAANGFPQPQFHSFSVADYEKSPDSVVSAIESVLPYPVIVKPNALGSSIGISTATNRDELVRAVDLAATLDGRIIAEELIADPIEINCAAYRDGTGVHLSKCMVIEKDAVYDFEQKYLAGGTATHKKGGAPTEAPEMSAIFDEIRRQLRDAYELFDVSGVVRADFLVKMGDDGPTVYLNEVNTVPGFLSYHLWLAAGVSYTSLIERVVTQAITESRATKTTSFTSGVLAKNRSLVD
ncbi:MAG: hypothetical protein FWE38_04180 [Firmicutes bacterium]|nr:hypothetical protein [Bacillota bacterium]